MSAAPESGASSAQHTPGPWTAYNNAAYGTAIMAGSMTGQHVASVQQYVGLSLETYTANARLIAAAPDMLAALTALVGMVSCMMDERKCPEMTAARAALAKAAQS